MTYFQKVEEVVVKMMIIQIYYFILSDAVHKLSSETFNRVFKPVGIH